MEINKIIQGDTLAVLKTFPDECVDSAITSPPYFGLRDYQVEGQLGLEKSLGEYLDKLLLVTKELKRVLKKSGVVFWNHGDSYGTGSGAGSRAGSKQGTNRQFADENLWYKDTGKEPIPGYEKSLLLQAHRLAIRMVDEQGWILRNVIIWEKPNVMPSSVKDRFTVDYEPVFLFAKSKDYYFEQQFEPHQEASIKRAEYGWHRGKDYPPEANVPEDVEKMGERFVGPLGRNKRCVWKIPTHSYKAGHFATFPEELVLPMVRAGCPEFICKKCGKARKQVWEGKSESAFNVGARDTKAGRFQEKWGDSQKPRPHYEQYQGDKQFAGEGKKLVGLSDCGCDHSDGWNSGIVLDPFSGSGTTAVVARKLGRNYLGIELNPKYIELAEERLKQQVLL